MRTQTLRILMAGGPLLDIATRFFYWDAARKLAVRAADGRLQMLLDQDEAVPPAWRAIRRQRLVMVRAILHTVDRLVERHSLAPHVARVVAKLWGRVLLAPQATHPAARRFREQHGYSPPGFLVISPGHACNLACPGCYASSGPEAGKLDWSTLSRITTEAKDLWGVPLFVFSGGEPLAYRSQGKTILDAVEAHPDCLFLMFTNGTLIDEQIAARLARMGNLTPALSVEGMLDRTDERRGAGTFDRVLGAMAHLRQAGVPFGFSVTVTRASCDEILSDEFLDFFFDAQGAFYGFLFEYMPIGRSPALDLMPTPEQALQLWRACWDVVARKQLFLVDFWSHGPLVEGCVAAGRDMGYLYIDWNGQVMPCVFAPYSALNINQVYARGGNLDDVWAAPFFEAVRRWQRDYGYGRAEPSSQGNWLHACPFRDHHAVFRDLARCHQAEPEDDAAREVFADAAYQAEMVAWGSRHREISQEIWEKEYLGGGLGSMVTPVPDNTAR